MVITLKNVVTLQVLGTPSQEDLAYVRLLSAAAAQFIETQPIVPSTDLDILFPDAPRGVSSLLVGCVAKTLMSFTESCCLPLPSSREPGSSQFRSAAAALWACSATEGAGLS